METSARKIARLPILKLFTSACILCIVSCSADKQQLPYYNNAYFTPFWADQNAQTDTIHRIAPFSFTDQDGNTINNETFKDHVYVANFFFTSCNGICPKMNGALQQVADTFKTNEDVLLLSHTVFPERDTVEALKNYAKIHSINSSKWHLVRGDKSAINSIARNSYYVEKTAGLSKDSTEFVHTENMLLIDKNGHIRGLYKGTLAVDALRLIDDIKLLLKE